MDKTLEYYNQSASILHVSFNELTIIETMITGDVRKGREKEKWLNGVVRKN